MLFVDPAAKRHPRLFLPRLLGIEANKPTLDGLALDGAFAIAKHWADLADDGHLGQKETSLDAEFMEKLFGDALGYASVSESPEEYHREKQFTVAGAGTADGALGRFSSGKVSPPVAIIELKGADTDLDHDKFNGRTPVQQCWDYLNQLPETPWGIVSNYVTIRLYHRNRPARAYEEFTVSDLRDPARFREFFVIFERNGLLGNKVQPPRADTLLHSTFARQRQVGEDLYADYSAQRLGLIEHLIAALGRTQDEAIHIAQKVIDRIVFVAFCEDRGLLPERLINRAYNQLPAFSKVVNPRWQNFKALFGLIDKGDADHGIPEFNGGLFRTDPAVDDLELDDQWTHFFERVDRYDFKDEVNVDVLGKLFEQSITELEKLRMVGLFGKMADEGQLAFMPKSAQRKRFGVYYTPPPFTELIVENTLGRLIRDRVEPVDDPAGAVAALRAIRCVDPACGSGAFLIAAYQRLEDAYEAIARRLRIYGRGDEAEALSVAYPDHILADNLFGVDLSPEAVEITQLALWIRSARRGRTLADLSRNIVCGNSLIADAAIHPRAMGWAEAFPAVFADGGGFDVVIGNPPWERMKVQEREFFSLARPDIASAVSAADRKKLIAAVEGADPKLWGRYREAKAAAERVSASVRASGDYPLTARGDINTYMLFAELATKLVNPAGRMGLLLPSGIATDDTTRHFFNDLMESKRLIALYDFENKLGWFPDVDGRFKFCVLLVAGVAAPTPAADFVFYAHKIEDLTERDRHIDLTAKDLALLNPNTRTCPIFRRRADAALTKRIYRNAPILVDHSRRSGGNSWGVRFLRMFDQTNDAGLFRTAGELKGEGFTLDGNRWTKRKSVYLPLYEAKMIQAYDHRAAGVVIVADNWFRQGQKEATSLVSHGNPEFTVLPRWWATEEVVRERLSPTSAILAFKNVTSPTNQRSMIAAFVPYCGLINSAPLIGFGDDISYRLRCCFLGNLNSLAYDYIARQKIGNVNLNFFIIEQIPTFPPDRYDERCPWDSNTTLLDWISERVLKLSCTAEDMVPLAEAAGFGEKVHPWRENDRERLRAELDAAFFILYGVTDGEIEGVLDSFQGKAGAESRGELREAGWRMRGEGL